jgi:hypothetical protein
MFEIVALFPLFPGTNELDQVQKIHAILGTPSKSVLNKFRRGSGGGGEDTGSSHIGRTR